VVILGLAFASCNGPSRGSRTQPSAASGFNVILTASPNVVRAANPNSDSDDGGAALVQAKVYDQNGNLVDGATVFFTTNLGVFRQGTEDFLGLAVVTTRGLANAAFVAQDQVGTATIQAVVEDAVYTTQITIF
jgi:hypothetical protein